MIRNSTMALSPFGSIFGEPKQFLNIEVVKGSVNLIIIILKFGLIKQNWFRKLMQSTSVIYTYTNIK